MIINEQHRFIFVHIPKCAGTTVRFALKEYDDRAGVYFGKGAAEHPVLGCIDHHHLPLAVIRDHFPEDFALFRTYESFALIRDPFERFASSLHERMVQTQGRRLSDLSADEIARETDTVISLLSKTSPHDPITDPGLIHFARQTDFVSLDGQQIVKHLYPTSHVPELIGRISRLVGKCIKHNEKNNRRLSYKYKVLSKADHIVRKHLEASLPKSVWRPASKSLRDTMIFLGILNETKYTENRDENNSDDFISEYYRFDIDLLQKIKAHVDII